ncbi:MAG: DegV family protein [Chloroflexota bacterium]|nr:DegV family protein [Chloroflexota bacterium]
MTSHRIALITDSTCDIPQTLLDTYDITVVPLLILWGDEVLRDRIDLQPQAFYQRLTEDPMHPKTAHPNPPRFARAYEEARENGAQEIVMITISSEMSGTFNAAQQAAKQVDIPVYCLDARGPTMSLGWQVLAAARAREAGGDAQAMLAAAKKVRQGLVQLVCLDTLEYLHKGGRIGGATRFIGTLLHVKPIVYIDHEAGRVEPATQVRTRSRALETLYGQFFEQLDTRKPLHIAVLHGDALEDAQRMAQRIRRDYAPAELLISITGPVLGVHTGPGAIALCGYAEG